MLPIKTKEQRRVVYERALRLVNNEKDCRKETFWFQGPYTTMGVCEILMDVLGKFGGSYEDYPFPEWELFRGGTNEIWWPIKDRASREIALLFCIEMCK